MLLLRLNVLKSILCLLYWIQHFGTHDLKALLPHHICIKCVFYKIISYLANTVFHVYIMIIKCMCTKKKKYEKNTFFSMKWLFLILQSCRLWIMATGKSDDIVNITLQVYSFFFFIKSKGNNKIKKKKLALQVFTYSHSYTLLPLLIFWGTSL